MNEQNKEATYTLKDLEKDAIVKTNYGVKNVMPCFGFMSIKDPNGIASKPFQDPDQMQEVKREYVEKVREMLQQTSTCTTCHNFDKCAWATLNNKMASLITTLAYMVK